MPDQSAASSRRRLRLSFTPWKFVGAMVVLVPTLVVVCTVAAFIPTEDVPRVEEHAGGSTAYYFNSLRKFILVPVGVLSLIVFSVVAVRVVPRPQDPRRPPPAGILKAVSYALATLLYGLLLLLALSVVVIQLYVDIRVITVREDSVVCDSLLRSRELPRGEIARIEFRREERWRGRNAWEDLKVVVVLRNGKALSTGGTTHEKGDPAIARYADVATQLQKQLKP